MKKNSVNNPSVNLAFCSLTGVIPACSVRTNMWLYFRLQRLFDQQLQTLSRKPSLRALSISTLQILTSGHVILPFNYYTFSCNLGNP